MMLENFFENCHLDNPVFRSGLFWMLVFAVCLYKVYDFKRQEAKETAIENEIIRKYIQDHKIKRIPAHTVISRATRSEDAKTPERPASQVKELPVKKAAEVKSELPPKKTTKKKKTTEASVRQGTYEPGKVV